jgi:putative resolvase
MKLSAYARQVGVTYKTAYAWWKAGQVDAYQLPTGTIIVRAPKDAATGWHSMRVSPPLTKKTT